MEEMMRKLPSMTAAEGNSERTLSTASCHAAVEASSMKGMSPQTTSTGEVSPTTTTTATQQKKSSPHLPMTRSMSVCDPSDKKSKGGKGGVARQKRNSWMRSSVVRRAASVVDEEVAALCEKSPFLNSLHSPSGNTNAKSSEDVATTTTTTTSETNNQNTASEMAVFHRLEVQLGKFLGKGGFAEVYAVAGFIDDDSDDEEEGTEDPVALRRRECQAAVTTSAGRPNYAIKFLRKSLLSNTREFQHAAIDMAVEAQYLTALNHPNIIKIRGLTRGGTEAFRSGKHDDYFLIMDHLQETLERRMQRWQQRHMDDGILMRDDSLNETGTVASKLLHPASQYYHRSLKYAQQIADALAYLHDKSIVYRDLKPANLGFRERDVIQLFDFGLCRELPKPKGQSHRDEDMEDEETFHMSGVGTQRYMAPEILNTRRYNLKADVFSWSMVVLEIMSWTKPFSEYTPQEHQFNVARWGERPRLVVSLDDDDYYDEEDCDASAHTNASANANQDDNDDDANSHEVSISDDLIVSDAVINDDGGIGKDKQKRKRANAILVKDWPVGLKELVEEAWAQDVGDRLTMQSVLKRLEPMVSDHSTDKTEKSVSGAGGILGFIASQARRLVAEPEPETDIFSEFPSHFSPIHTLSVDSRQQHYQQQQRHEQEQRHHTAQAGMMSDDSDSLYGDRQSESSGSLQELTMTSTSTTLHDSTSTPSTNFF